MPKNCQCSFHGHG